MFAVQCLIVSVMETDTKCLFPLSTSRCNLGGGGGGGEADNPKPRSRRRRPRSVRRREEVQDCEPERSTAKCCHAFSPRYGFCPSPLLPMQPSSRVVPFQPRPYSKRPGSTFGARLRSSPPLPPAHLPSCRVVCQAIHAKNSRHMLLDMVRALSLPPLGRQPFLLLLSLFLILFSPLFCVTHTKIDYLEPTMVIVGTRGLSQVKGMLLGSVSNYLLQRSSVPVMVRPSSFLSLLLPSQRAHNLSLPPHPPIPPTRNTLAGNSPPPAPRPDGPQTTLDPQPRESRPARRSRHREGVQGGRYRCRPGGTG